MYSHHHFCYGGWIESLFIIRKLHTVWTSWLEETHQFVQFFSWHQFQSNNVILVIPYIFKLLFYNKNGTVFFFLRMSHCYVRNACIWFAGNVAIRYFHSHDSKGSITMTIVRNKRMSKCLKRLRKYICLQSGLYPMLLDVRLSNKL